MDVTALAAQLKSGAISLPEWQAAMRESLRSDYKDAMYLTRGGIENVSQSDWGYVGSSLKKQYAYLDQFATDIAADPVKWKTGRLDNRMRLYNQSGYSALEEFKARDVKIAGWTEERRVLGTMDNCFLAGTKITTPNGKVAIEKIRAGDIIATRFGDKRVTRTYKLWYPKSDMYTVISGKNKITVTKNHPLLTQSGWKRVDELSRFDNIVLFENSANYINTHVAFPYSGNGIATLCNSFIFFSISCVRQFLYACRVLVSRMAVPIIPIGLDNEITDLDIRNKAISNRNLGFVFRNSEKFENIPKLFFQSTGSFLLKCSIPFSKSFYIFGPAGLFSNSFACARELGRVMKSHVFGGLFSNYPTGGRFGQADLESIGFVYDGFLLNSKRVSTPFSTVFGIIIENKIDLSLLPRKLFSAIPKAAFTFFRVPIFFISAMANKAATLFKSFSGTVSTQTRIALSDLSTTRTWYSFGSWFLMRPALTAQIHASRPEITTARTGSPLYEFGRFIMGYICHIPKPFDNDKHNQIIPRYVLVYDLEVDGVHEYIANNFVVHNCTTSKSGLTGCKELAAKGWQPIGSLPPIGGAPCNANCKCRFEYRRPKVGGGWEYER
jgi:hypothetical protein